MNQRSPFNQQADQGLHEFCIAMQLMSKCLLKEAYIASSFRFFILLLKPEICGEKGCHQARQCQC